MTPHDTQKYGEPQIEILVGCLGETGNEPAYAIAAFDPQAITRKEGKQAYEKRVLCQTCTRTPEY